MSRMGDLQNINKLGLDSITHSEFAMSKISLLQQYKIADNEFVMSYGIDPLASASLLFIKVPN
jgi:hypothetical protein